MTATSTTNPGFSDALRVREFRWLWLTDAQSALGDQLARVAITVLVFAETSSAALTALAFSMSYLPALLGGVFLSGLADRFPRRRVLIVCDLVRAVLVGLMALPRMPLVGICILIAAEVFVGSLFVTAESALIPDVLPVDVFPVATAVRTTTHQICQLLGFAAGGLVVAAIGARAGLVVDAMTFLISGVAIRVVIIQRPSAMSNVDDAAGFSSINSSVRAIFGDARVRTLAYLIWLVALYGVNEGVAAPYAESFGGGSATIGLLLAATPTGTALGAIALTHCFSTEQRDRLIGPLAIGTGLPLALCALEPGFGITIGLWFISGVMSSYFVPAITQFTVRLPNETRGQSIGLAAALLMTAQGLAIALGGVVAESVGAAHAVAIGGIVGAAIAGGLAYVLQADARSGSAGAGSAGSGSAGSGRPTT